MDDTRSRLGMTVMVLAKVQERGQFTVPAKLREAVGLKPGDTLLLRAVGPGRFEAIALPHRALSTFFEEHTARDVSLDQLREEMGREVAAEYAPDVDAARQEAAAAGHG